MPRFKKEKFVSKNKAGASLVIDVVININADGEFYASLPDYLFDAFGGSATYSRAGTATFKVLEKTYEKLRHVIYAGLARYLEPNITETAVIQYNIESHVSFALDEQGNIFPNAGFPGANWPVGDRDLYGGHHAANPSKGGYTLTIGARAMLKRTISHGENVKVEYVPYYAGGSQHNHEHPAELLNSWCSMDLGSHPKEIPYSDKAALFFHSLLFGMATLSRQVQTATFDQENLLKLIESQSRFPLLGAVSE